MPNEDEREQALQQAARLKGLSLVRAGDGYALAIYTAATLDEIADFLTADPLPDAGHRHVEEQRRADLWAILRAERALIAELEEQKRKVRTGGTETIETALAEIRRRIAEIEDTRRTQA
jgi:DnaJ-domain-containing protein 1